jgi:hypothetical protein
LSSYSGVTCIALKRPVPFVHLDASRERGSVTLT